MQASVYWVMTLSRGDTMDRKDDIEFLKAFRNVDVILYYSAQDLGRKLGERLKELGEGKEKEE